MLYATHDQVEAMTLADRIVVFSSGRVEQVGAPLELYHRPANLFVAGFIGSPRMNFLKGEMVSGSRCIAVIKIPGGEMLMASVAAGHLKPGVAVTVGVRPDTVSILSDVAAAEENVNQLSAVARHTEQTGDATMLYAEVNGATDSFVARFPGSFSAEHGSRLILSVSPPACHVFDSEGNALCRASVPIGAAKR